MKTVSPLLILFFFFAPSLLSQITISPSAPHAGESFDVRVDGIWADSCVPMNPRLFIADKKLIVTFALSGGACLSALTAYSVTTHIPPLAAGTYELSARLLASKPQPFFGQTIEVSGEPSGITSITSAFDTSAGNRVVKIRGAFPCSTTPCAPPTVLFETKPAEAVERVSDSEIDAVAPTQTQVGVVDVTVRGDGYNYVLPSGFTYVNLLDYERFLVPVLTRKPVPGGFGSLWRSELRLVNETGIALEPGLDIFHVETADAVVPNHVVTPTIAMPLADSDDPPTTMFYVRRELARYLTPQLRIRDLSREAETWGTEIPVVRESFIGPTFTLVDIPMKPGFRQMFRLYMTDYVGCCAVNVTFLSPAGEVLARHSIFLQHSNGSIGGLVPPPYLREGSRQFPLQPAYSQIDLQSIPELAGQDTIWIRAESNGQHLWGFVSVTNDATQHVTTITPH